MAWWESSAAGGWDNSGADAKWGQNETAPQNDDEALTKKIKQLREGKWTDQWKEFEYYDDATGAWIKDALDQSIGTRGMGWWPFLWHEGKEWQPEDLANHLESQLSTPAEQPQWGSAAPAAPADSWGQSWGQSAGTGAAPTPSAKAFWEMQKYNIENGVLSKKEPWELDQDDTALFSERLGSSAGIDFGAYASVPVDVSGDKSSNIPVCETFDQIYQNFQEMIPAACIENVRRCQYEVPTPVQKYAVPVGLAGRDVMCCAQTGSGKTAAFLIPVIGRMMVNHDQPVGSLDVPFEGKCFVDTLIMTPTRELCIQIHEEAQKMCHRTAYRCSLLYGGAPTKGQLEDISKGCDLMVACPGRLQDFMERGVVDVSRNFVLVLDEADRMLDMGFEKQIRDIVENHSMPSKEDRQTMMFSATFAEECQKMAQDFLFNYIWVGVGVVGGAVTTVTQILRKVNPKEKYNQLITELDQFYDNRQNSERCLVFVNAKDTAKWLDEQLYDKNMDTGALHGNLTQQERELNLGRFRRGEIDVMVATDVAARGLDIEKVDLIINYDVPKEIDTYVHRIGRSGRIGNRGTAISFVSVDDNGTALDDSAMLAKLLKIMKDAGSEAPQWFEEQVSSNGAWAATADSGENSWKDWGGKDMRADWSNWKQ